MRVFKYPLAIEQRELLHLPRDAKIISVVVQNGAPVLYALVDERMPLEQRIIRVVTTGENFGGEDCVFIGTLQIGEWFVAHVFEQTGVSPDVRSTRFAEDFSDIQKEVDEPLNSGKPLDILPT
jgi:hypothetical protein